MNTTQHKKEKITTTKFQKQFSTFENGIKGICNVEKVIADMILDNTTNPDNISQKEAAQTLLRIMYDNTPDIDKRENLLFDLTLSANRCFLKTNRFLGFGWYITSNNVNGKWVQEYFFTIIIYGENKTREANLLRDGWNLVEK